MGALGAFTALFGTRVIPRLLDHVAATKSRELFTLTLLALGIAVGSALVFTVSMARGAFLAGLVVGRSVTRTRHIAASSPAPGPPAHRHAPPRRRRHHTDDDRVEHRHAAGAATAGSLILTSAGMARAAYLRDIQELKRAGADTIYTGEGEVALAFIEDIMSRLGATPEQIDRERERAHKELFGE